MLRPHLHRFTVGLLLGSLALGIGRANEAAAQSSGLPAVVRYQVTPPPGDDEAARDHNRDRRAKAETDSIYRAYAASSFEFRKVAYASSDGLEIPAYVFAPQGTQATDRHPALIWVRGSAHGDWSLGYLPFVREAVARGYVVIAPEYRGSTGYGRAFYEAIDYGGHDVDDVLAAVEYAREHLPFVDSDRLGVMGWSHGGLITLLAVMRESHPFRAAAAIGPVSNLVFRLSYKGPSYQEFFRRQVGIGALPHERPDIYIERSPVYQVDKLRVPLMVHVATNDDDVDFVESEMLIHALQVKKPELSEIKVYENPPGGHAFSRMVNTHFQIIETPEMLDTWDLTWSFFERNLRPLHTAYE